MTHEPLRVMQLIKNLDVGGAQEVVRTLAAYLTEEGCEVVVCTFRDGPLREEIERLGIPVEVLPGRRHTVLALPQFLLEMVRIRRSLLDLVTRYEVDVIQTHLLRVLDFLVASLRVGRGRPLVFWTIHNYNFTLRPEHLSRHRWLLGPKRLGYRLLYRLVARWVNGFIAVSADVERAILQTIGPIQDKVTVICNGVDVRRYQRRVARRRLCEQLGLPEEAWLMSVVGTFKVQKGHRFLIEAAPPVVARFPNLHLLLIGDGDLRDQEQAHAARLGLAEHVHFLGNRHDVPDLLAASDSFVLPSLWEGLPMALIEAMASGLPIIATAVSGTTQAIVPGETGLLVQPGRSAALSEAMLDLLSDPARARTMGTAARQRAEAVFSATQQARAHVALFRQAQTKGG